MSEHIGADEAQRLLDGATPGPWYWHDYMKSGRTLAYDPSPTLGFDVHEMNVLKTTDDWHPTRADEALIAAAPRLAAEVVRLRRELDARTDPELAQRLSNHAERALRDSTSPTGYWVNLSEDMLDAARLLGGGE